MFNIASISLDSLSENKTKTIYFIQFNTIYSYNQLV